VPRGVRRACDAVAVALQACGLHRRGAADAVAVQDEHVDARARPQRHGRRRRLHVGMPHDRLRRDAQRRAMLRRVGGRELREPDGDQRDELDERDAADDDGCGAPRERRGTRLDVLHGPNGFVPRVLTPAR
jgi:hypothetical protein